MENKPYSVAEKIARRIRTNLWKKRAQGASFDELLAYCYRRYKTPFSIAIANEFLEKMLRKQKG